MDINLLIQKVKKTKHGFLDILKEAENFRKGHSVAECLVISKKLFSSEAYQARSLGTAINKRPVVYIISGPNDTSIFFCV